MPKKDDRSRVRLYPATDYYLPGVRAVERVVPADVADELLAAPHPAFTRDRPEGQDAPSDDALEEHDDIERDAPEVALKLATRGRAEREARAAREAREAAVPVEATVQLEPVLATMPGGTVIEPKPEGGEPNA